MTFEVDPEALRAYASRLQTMREYATTARSYVNSNGTFSAQETGLIGYLIPHHRTYMDALTEMLTHLAEVADASDGSMRAIAASYERSDTDAAARVDASYPVVARPPLNHEPYDREHRPPPTTW
ncbi:type VII secretion target [Actinoplanes sp. NPDC051633]|uniref:type VII secretion target n=1 Tax=Actinoplanes sp. NPDC051633 TaxID=3155670 RepID=UPI00342E8451